MQSIKKRLIFLKHIVKMVFSNNTRLILSISGLFVGLFILTIGMLLMNSYYGECMRKASEFADEVILLQIGGEEDSVNKLIKMTGLNVISCKNVSDDEKNIYIKKYTNDEYCILKTKIVGTTEMSDEKVLSQYDEDIYIPYEACLVSGRFINGSDVANANKVVVIDNFTAKLLFGDKNPLGEKLVLDVQADGMVIIEANDNEKADMDINEFEIIGIYENEIITSDNELELEKFKMAGESTLTLETMVYIPETVYLQMYEQADNYIIFNCSNDEEYNELLQLLKDYQKVYSSEFYKYNIITKNDVIYSLENELKPLKIFMWIIMIFLLIISGINSMNTMFFSVKERMGEIGIKKSLGAGKWDITVQFMLEGVFMALMAGISAVIFGILIGGYIGELIQSVMYISFTVTYSINTIVVPLGVAGVYGIVFSFLPSYYGANIKVVDALRFE